MTLVLETTEVGRGEGQRQRIGPKHLNGRCPALQLIVVSGAPQDISFLKRKLVGQSQATESLTSLHSYTLEVEFTPVRKGKPPCPSEVITIWNRADPPWICLSPKAITSSSCLACLDHGSSRSLGCPRTTELEHGFLEKKNTGRTIYLCCTRAGRSHLFQPAILTHHLS